jgi:hypothetical protein
MSRFHEIANNAFLDPNKPKKRNNEQRHAKIEVE